MSDEHPAAGETLHGDDEDRPRIQLVVGGDTDRTALAEMLAERYEVVVADDLQAVDGYLIGDRMMPAVREELADIKTEAHPTFTPALAISRQDAGKLLGMPVEPDENEIPLIDEVVTAPVDRSTLYRRLRNLLVRRQQSVAHAERVETTERRFQQLFESTNDALFVLDGAAERFEQVNPAARSLLGYSAAELTSLSPAAVFDHDDDGGFRSFFRSVQSAGGEWTNELRCVCADGDERLLEVSGAILEDTEHPPVVLSARDITERKRYQRELELRAAAMDGAPIGITITDPHQEDNPMVYVNQGFTEITGYSPEETLGRNCRFLQGPETDDEPVAALREAIDAEEPVAVDLQNYRKDGTVFWNRVTVAPVRNDAGDVTHFIGFQEDVTDRKEREQQLQLFQQAVENVAQSVVITDRGGRIEYVNSAFEAESGYPAAEVRGKTPSILKSGKHDEAFYRELWGTILDGEVWESDLINKRKSGELYQVHESISPIVDETGEITHFVAIEQDVSDRRIREQQLSVLNRLLRHNLRNGLNVIRGNAELLSGTLPADHQRFIRPIEERAAGLSQLSQKVGTVQSLFEEDHDEAIHCDIEALFERVHEEFATAYPAATLRIEAAPSLAVRADSRLELALVELLDNAVVHNDASEPTVRLSARPAIDDPVGEWVEIVVCDDGPGIPDHERQVIERGVETPLQHGTGLGLWIAYWTVSLFGGEITIEDDEPGTRVVLRLPRADSA